MRIVLAGTRSFGSAVLEQVLKDGHDVEAVFAPVDDALHRRAVQLLIPAYPHVNAGLVRAAQADVGVAAHSHTFVGRESRGATRLGWIGYHPSLLPRHRGKSSVEWTIRMGDPIAGGTVYWLDSGVDTGPIARQDFCHVVPGWTANDLWREQLFPMGVRLLRDTLRDLVRGWLISLPQDERVATVEPAIEPVRLHRPELPAIEAGPSGFEVVASREHPALA